MNTADSKDKRNHHNNLWDSGHRRVLDKMIEGYQIIDHNWQYVYVNDAAASHGRRSKEDLLGHSMMEVYPEIENTEMFGFLKRCLQERVPHHMENEFVYPGGRKGWFELSIHPAPEGIFILSIDITEKKSAEEKREQLLHALEERLKELNCIFRLEEAIRKNDHLEGLFKEVVGIIPSGWHYPAITRSRITYCGDTYQSEGFKETKWKQGADIMINGEKQGSVEVYYLEKKPDLYEGPFLKEERKLLNNITQNITEAVLRKKAENLLAFNEERYRSIISNLPGGLVHILDKDFRYVFNAGEELEKLGLSDDSLNGKSIYQVLPPGTATMVAERYKQVLRGQTVRFEGEYNGNYFVSSASPLPDRNGSVGQILVLSLNITERKDNEARISNLLDQLTAKNKELEQLLYATSHDLRTPLVNIQGFSNELQPSFKEIKAILDDKRIPEELGHKARNIMDEDIQESIRYILSSTEKMDRLLSGLLTLSRLGRQELKVVKVDMNSLIEDVVSDYKHPIKKANVHLEVADLPPCHGDPSQLNRVFTNLLGNAIKFLYADRPGKIKIYAKKEKHAIRYVVEDNGIGISPNLHKKIFDIFHQVNPSISGQGLGLTIVKQILERHGAGVDVESAEGNGSRFIVIYPA